MFDGRTASIPGAAFAAAPRIDDIVARDGDNPTTGHIGCAALPVLYAVAEDIPDLSARGGLVRW